MRFHFGKMIGYTCKIIDNHLVTILIATMYFLSSGVLLQVMEKIPSFIWCLCYSGALLGAVALIIPIVRKIRHFVGEWIIARQIARRDTERERCAQEGKPIKVAFLCDNPSFWTAFEELYREMEKAPHFEATLVAIPEIQSNTVVNNKMEEFFEASGIPYIKGETDFLCRLKNYEYHYVFPSRPYDHVRPDGLKNGQMKRWTQLCHIAYGTCIFNGKILDTVCGFHHLKDYSYVFSETDVHSQIYENKKRRYPKAETKIVQVGSPKFEAIRGKDFTVDAGMKYEQVILYTPRWTENDGTSSFNIVHDKLYALAKADRNVKYILRPHPLMKKRFSEEEWTKLVESFDEENIVIDLKPEYFPSFKEATVLVSDMSSLLAEFMLTGKPVVYFHRKWQVNPFGKSILGACYYCSSWEAVERSIKSLRRGNDPKKQDRERVIAEDFYFPEETSVTLIEDCLRSEYMLHTKQQSNGGAELC